MLKITSNQTGNQNEIKLPTMVDRAFAEAFMAQQPAWLIMTVDHHVLDFTAVLSFDSSTYSAFSSFAKILKANGKQLYSVNVPRAVQARFVAEGMNKLFIPKPVATKESLDVRFVNPFLESVEEVFQLQAKVNLTPQKPYIQTEISSSNLGIVALVGLNTKQFRGTIALCFSTEVFLKIYCRMMGETLTEIGQDTEDAAGELLNIVYGRAKTILNKDFGMDLQPALPTVLRGEKLSLRRQNNCQTIVLPFASEVGVFHVEISIQPASNETEKRSA